MDFLNKLYESNYFGIGLFAVISFLVITFLVVLFFGKKDEKKRRLTETKDISTTNRSDLFKETSVETKVEVPVNNEPVAPVIPVEPNINIEPTEPVMPTNEVKPFDSLRPINYVEEPITPVAPISYEEPKEYIENLKFEEPQPVITPIETIVNEPVAPVIPEPIKIEPIRLEPTTYDIPVEPKVMEPIKIEIPDEPIEAKPVITEEVKPIITPIIEEPVINETYYKPAEKVESDEIEVPSIDFDALAKSISQELDELEKTPSKPQYNEVKVTPINEVASKPSSQFSSVYVTEPAKKVVPEPIELPKTIDLPTMKNDEIKPENYNL